MTIPWLFLALRTTMHPLPATAVFWDLPLAMDDLIFACFKMVGDNIAISLTEQVLSANACFRQLPSSPTGVSRKLPA
jgi:hypothetical protein